MRVCIMAACTQIFPKLLRGRPGQESVFLCYLLGLHVASSGAIGTVANDNNSQSTTE